MPDLPALSRSLLTPGPMPPTSHFGLTLMRHVVGTGLRYSLYQLGLPLPEAPPIRLVGLRLFLDRIPLEELLREAEGGDALLRALLAPGDAATERLAQAPAVAAGLHRRRLRWSRRRPARALRDVESLTPGELWKAFETVVSSSLPALNDAILGELVATLERQRRRLEGLPVEPALGREAWRARAGRPARTELLGRLDPLTPSWAEDVERLVDRVKHLSGQPLPRKPGARGRFREVYRGFLSNLRPILRALGRRGLENDVVDDETDLFFVPYPLVEELAGDLRPSWLEGAVTTNRAEYEALLRAPEAPDEILGSPALAEQADRSDEWELTPLRTVA